jgi:hypothetical protein
VCQRREARQLPPGLIPDQTPSDAALKRRSSTMSNRRTAPTVTFQASYADSGADTRADSASNMSCVLFSHT